MFSVVSDSLWHHGLWCARLLCWWDSPGKNTGVGNHALLQGIFLTLGPNQHLPCLLYWQVCSLPLAPSGKILDNLDHPISSILSVGKFTSFIPGFWFSNKGNSALWIQGSAKTSPESVWEMGVNYRFCGHHRMDFCKFPLLFNWIFFKVSPHHRIHWKGQSRSGDTCYKTAEAGWWWNLDWNDDLQTETGEQIWSQENMLMGCVWTVGQEGSQGLLLASQSEDLGEWWWLWK